MGPRAAILLAALVLASPSLARADGCVTTVSVGLDTTQASFLIADWFSNQAAEVFDAPETVLTAITVWQWPHAAAFRLGKLYVMEVDTLAGIVRPDEKKILLEGPALPGTSGDGTQATPLTWFLDPPLILPRRGQFAFEIAPGSCGDGSMVFVGRSGDPYPGGSYWSFDSGGCGPGCCPDNPWDGTIDLAFRADFCEQAVATRPETWGRLRAAYR